MQDIGEDASWSTNHINIDKFGREGEEADGVIIL